MGTPRCTRTKTLLVRDVSLEPKKNPLRKYLKREDDGDTEVNPDPVRPSAWKLLFRMRCK
ncbi:MAG: hypothetical protein Q9207_001973 [Kuettlingeria erythrocarpa]